jgi:hypothetical protein
VAGPLKGVVPLRHHLGATVPCPPPPPPAPGAPLRQGNTWSYKVFCKFKSTVTQGVREGYE